MYARQRTLTRYGRAAPPSTQSMTIPAPVGGINAYDSLMQMPPNDCIYTYNLMPVEYGLRLRKGYTEWATGCIESPKRGTAEVRTIIPYESNVNDVINDRLFAVTDEGIWDATNFGNLSPTQVATFTELGDEAGRGVWCEYTGAAADAPVAGARGHYLFYADGKNGIWQYTEQSGLWTRPPVGVAETDWYYLDPSDGTTKLPFPIDDVAYVMVFKQRIWVILENDDDAYYLPVASISGELTRFTFGSKLPHGGDLRGLWTWTLDGGAGIDDYLVAISRGGDVVIYQGEDPEIDFATRGAWFIGEVPESRRIVMEFGADLFMLSTLGITSAKALLSGAPVAMTAPSSPSAKINRFLREDVVNGKDLAQWQLTINPSDGFMQIVTPSPTNTPFVQYSMNLNTGAWGLWEGVPITCGYSSSGKYFMGAAEGYSAGTVLYYDGVADGERLPGSSFFTPIAGNDPQGYWSQRALGANDYECSPDLAGTSPAVYTIDTGVTSELGKQYQVLYTVSGASPSAKCAVIYGTDEYTNHISEGNGVFSVTITASQESSTVKLIAVIDGNDQFSGRVTEIAVRDAGSSGNPISFRTLTSFQSLGEHARLKRVGIARTIGVLAGTASFNVEAVYDYKIGTDIETPDTSTLVGQNAWDSAVWDSSTWDFDVEGKSFPVGVLGMGRAVAVGLRGNATTRINIVGWDMLLTMGGYL
jgi:hypothetical protein